MANVRTNIGKLGIAIESAKQAYADRNISPKRDPYLDFNVIHDLHSDVEYVFSPEIDQYMWGIHKWGDSKFKVGD